MPRTSQEGIGGVPTNERERRIIIHESRYQEATLSFSEARVSASMPEGGRPRLGVLAPRRVRGGLRPDGRPRPCAPDIMFLSVRREPQHDAAPKVVEQ